MDCKEVISPDVANKTAAPATASARQYYTSTRLGDGRPFAAKSGTTDGHANTCRPRLTPSIVSLRVAATARIPPRKSVP